MEAVPDRIAALEAELREAKRRLRAGSGPGVPKAAELVAAAREVAPGIRMVAQAGPWVGAQILQRPGCTSATATMGSMVAWARKGAS